MVNPPVAIVTGSGRRLGRQIAIALARNGFDLVVTYRSSHKDAIATCEHIQGLGRECIVVEADIRTPVDVEKLVNETRAKYEKIDVLVNNAGIFVRRPWDEVDLATWEDVLRSNLTGAFLCSQAFGREMVGRGMGRIINLASIGGIQAWAKHMPYSVSKAGVISLTRCFARALAPTVMVNAVAPGTILIEGEEDASIQHAPVERIPMKRYGTPRDITSLVVFLATTATYVTGQIFAADGGRSIDFLSA